MEAVAEYNREFSTPAKHACPHMYGLNLPPTCG